MTHPLSVPGRIRYMPIFSISHELNSYQPPSYYKQRFIDLSIIACILFPAYRRHQMREVPLYKFLDENTGQVIYYDNLTDYKRAIYNRRPKQVPNIEPGIYTRYEFDFRDKAYPNYLSYEPHFLRVRNWLTFNNERGRASRHFSHRLKDSRLHLNMQTKPAGTGQHDGRFNGLGEEWARPRNLWFWYKYGIDPQWPGQSAKYRLRWNRFESKVSGPVDVISLGHHRPRENDTSIMHTGEATIYNYDNFYMMRPLGRKGLEYTQVPSAEEANGEKEPILDFSAVLPRKV